MSISRTVSTSRKLLPLALALLLLAPADALAWDEAGHVIVSTVAYARLNPAAKARVDQLSRVLHFCGKTYDGTTLGAWMDDLKADTTHDDLRVWHYIDIPVFDGVASDPALLSRLQRGDDNAVARLGWAVENLRRGLGSDRKDAEMLGYVFHLAGDLHQPLHAATRVSAGHREGDAGGNDFRLAGVPEADNLHSYWDSAAGAFNFWRPERPLGERERRRLEAYVRELVADYPAESLPEAKELAPRRWAEESNALARSVAYALPENSKPSAEYVRKAQETARRRVALAGYRLANLLNSIFSETKPAG